MSVQDLFREYLKAYNAKDVSAMLRFFDEACVFENISGGRVTVRTEGKAALEALARRHDHGGDHWASADEQGRIVVERPHRHLAELAFGAKGRPSILATARYREVLKNLGVRRVGGGNV